MFTSTTCIQILNYFLFNSPRYNALTGAFMNHVLDPRYFGGVCEYIYNGEWRKLTYDPFCEHLSYDDAEKYYRKPYNFLTYQIMVSADISGSLIWQKNFITFNVYYAAHECVCVFFFLYHNFIRNNYVGTFKKSYFLFENKG